MRANQTAENVIHREIWPIRNEKKVLAQEKTAEQNIEPVIYLSSYTQTVIHTYALCTYRYFVAVMTRLRSVLLSDHVCFLLLSVYPTRGDTCGCRGSESFLHTV